MTSIKVSSDRSVLPLIRAHQRKYPMRWDSIVDVGCGLSRFDRWPATEPTFFTLSPSYVGLDTSPERRATLTRAGVTALHPYSPEGAAARGDLVAALEVIEHVSAKSTAAFLAECFARAKRLLVLSTPNYEYWLPHVDTPQLRFIPDHALAPNHLQTFSPESLAAVIAAALPPGWHFELYRAWPWHLTDQTRNKTFEVYYKLHVIAWPAT